MHTLDNLIFRERKTVWMDWNLLLWESWKVLRGRKLPVWFKDMVEKLPNQWARKQVMPLWDRILESKNFLRYIVIHRSRKETKKQKHEHQHIGCTFFPKFLLKIRERLTAKIPGKLATNLHKLTQLIGNSLVCVTNWQKLKNLLGKKLIISFASLLASKRAVLVHRHKLIFLAEEVIKHCFI